MTTLTLRITDYKSLKGLIISALLYKADSKHTSELRFGSYRYDEFILPKARLLFPKYSALYPKNDEFIKKFAQGIFYHDANLLQEIGAAKTLEEETKIVNEANETASTEHAQAASEGVRAETPHVAIPSHLVPHVSVPKAPQEPAGQQIPEDVKQAFQDEPEHMTNPDLASSPPTPVPPAFTRAFNPPNIPTGVTSGLKTASSGAQIFTSKGLSRIGRGLGEMIKGVGGGIGGPMLNSTYKGLGKVGNGGLNAFGRLSNISGPRLNGISKLKGFGTGKKVILAFGLFGLFFGFSLFSAIQTEQTPTTEASPVSADLLTCKFTRGDRNPAAVSYQSPKLLSYFQAAEKATSVPAVVLAAIARVESPSAVNLTDESLALFNCPRSPTGALGLMQIQPAGTRGGFSQGLELGASFLNKTVDQLTEADFCDVKSSIILSGGFILKKLQLGYGIGDGTKWDPAWNSNQDIIYKVASGYYGCLEYGGGDPLKCTGPYNYGLDIWTSINSCQPGANIATGSVVPSGVGGERIASAAKQIASQLVHSTNPGMPGCDPGGTYGPSYHCWSEMASYDQAHDTNYLQCTEFVWAAFDKAGYGRQINEIRSGNAGDWPDLARRSQDFIVFNDPSQLQPGDIISVGQGGIVSHVAIVVERSANQVKVAQSATSAPLESEYIDSSNNLVIPGAGQARKGTIGFIRMKGG